MSDEVLWSARNVAEFAYCPRLFYYLQVEGVFNPSSDTEQGRAVHRRVNKPSTTAMTKSNSESNPREPGRPQIVRSLVLTSQKLKLTATLDLAEITDQSAVPVEYRKGKAKRSSKSQVSDNNGDIPRDLVSHPEAWPTDRIQVALQALLLEEAGYKVDKAVLYYSGEKLRLTLPITDTVKAEALDMLRRAEECAKGTRPLPLVNDPRCQRCSLQPICLPDEVNHQRATSPTEDLIPRKIWPPHNDSTHIIAQTEGIHIGLDGNSLKVVNKEGQLVKNIPLAGVESLSLLGPIQITTQAVHTLADMGIPVAYLSSAGRLVAMIDPLDSVSAKIRRAQIRKFDDPQTCLALGKALIVAKIANQRTLLMRNCENLPDGVAEAMNCYAEQAGRATTLDALRGYEGQAANVYFSNFSRMLKGPLATEFNMNGRKRRPPPDPINSCLSLGYSMLTHECVSALRLARLEPSIGAFHTFRPGRPAFALDLMEPFRPLIADSIAITAFNRGELIEGHFIRSTAGCALTDAGRRVFFNAWARRMDTDVTHPVFEYRLSYRRMIVLHARMIAAWLVDEIPELAFLTTR